MASFHSFEGSRVVLAPLPTFHSVPQHERPDLHITPAEVSDLDERRRVLALLEAVRERDIVTFEHSRRVAIYAQRLARALGKTRSEATQYAMAGQIHDAGKSWINNDILKKTGELTEAEYHTIRAHVLIGERMAVAYDLPELLRQAARSHHEAFDGSGYPDGLSGTAIPEVARVVAVVDAFDVITTDRPYKEASDMAAALAEIERQMGYQFDPTIASTFITLARKAETFLVEPRLCVVGWRPSHLGAWYQIVTRF
jgi:putative two-component system response regulator